MTWRERVGAARQRGYFTRYENDLAGHWLQCAVGEQRAAAPLIVKLRSSTGEPTDPTLTEAGGQFATAVYENDFDRADMLLDLIDDRVLMLKRIAPLQP